MKLLFTDTQNAWRRILGAAITRKIAGDRNEVLSAGNQQAGRIRPLNLRFPGKHGHLIKSLHASGTSDPGYFQPGIVKTVCNGAADVRCPVELTREALTTHRDLPDSTRVAETDYDNRQALMPAGQKPSTTINAVPGQTFKTLKNCRTNGLLQSLQDAP